MPKTHYRHFLHKLFSAAGIAILLTATTGAYADSWPNRDVHVITPFPAGGINDLVIRAVTKVMSEELGQTIIVEQKTGAGGNIGTSYVAKSKPDGYTWLASSFPVLSIAPVLYDDAPFDPIKDFRGAAKLAAVPNVLVVDPSLGINTIDELISYGKANPDGLFYGSPAKGSSANVGSEELKRAGEFNATQVLYKGAGPALIDLATGRIQFTQTSISLALPQIKTGKIKALAVMSDTPSSLLPDIPTMKDSKYREAVVEPWYGIHVPANTPKEIITKINKVALHALQSSEVQEQIAGFGGTIAAPLSPEVVDKETEHEVKRWQTLAQEVDFRAGE